MWSSCFCRKNTKVALTHPDSNITDSKIQNLRSSTQATWWQALYVTLPLAHLIFSLYPVATQTIGLCLNISSLVQWWQASNTSTLSLVQHFSSGLIFSFRIGWLSCMSISWVRRCVDSKIIIIADTKPKIATARSMRRFEHRSIISILFVCLLSICLLQDHFIAHLL